MTETQKQLWEQERAKGEFRFVLREGLLRRGLPFAAIMTAFRLVYDSFTHRPIESPGVLVIGFALNLLLFGGCMGTMIWRDREKEF